MSIPRISRVGVVAALAALGAGWGVATAADAPVVVDDAAAEVQILARGPVHEAFAVTVAFDPEPGIVVPKAPPDAIEELPPEQQPEGANVTWIPGYWAWDDDNGDFLWVSGIWRNLPPDRQWVPGYWSPSAQGAQWTSGYWADAQASEIDYLPEPPQSMEAGPNIEAPAEDQIWVPGCWVWQQNRYMWRPGFWTPSYANWVWTPAHYQWAPRGYVYVGGYWDYTVPRRGLLFAPVRFNQSVYAQQGFSYTPSTVIDLGVFASHLFLRPNYGHYYYGDYYGANYTTAGFYPSYSYHSSRQGYDPIYAHQRWSHRQDRDWERRVQADFQRRRDHEEARPPRTFAAQQELVRKAQSQTDRVQVFARPLDQFIKSPDSQLRFQPLNNDDRQRLVRRGQEVRTFREQRQKLEAQPRQPAVERSARAQVPSRIQFPRSPLVGRGANELGKEFAPPKTHTFPQPDPKVTPKPRQDRGRSAARDRLERDRGAETPKAQANEKSQR